MIASIDGVCIASRRLVSLAELNQVAGLQTRMDRKYLLPASFVARLVRSLHCDTAVLQIGGCHSFRYETLYFDTEDLESYLLAARRRPQRFKARIRSYLDSELSMLEVKHKNRRAATVKERVEQPFCLRDRLTEPGERFVDATLNRPGLAERLGPVLTTSFSRSTFLDRRDGSRVTLDSGLVWSTPLGWSMGLENHVVLETKSVGAATEADRWLWEQGFRPVPFSKYCCGMALNTPTLPAHKWSRTLRQQLDWVRATPAPGPAARGA